MFYSSYTLAKLIPIRCIKCLHKIKKQSKIYWRNQVDQKSINLTNTEIDELNKLGIKLKFFGMN